MTIKLNATQAKARFLALLDQVAAGEDVEITRHGRSVARLVPANGVHALRGAHAGVVTSVADDEQLFSTGLTWNLE